MAMPRIFLPCLMLLIPGLITSALNAATWTSPDGKISFTKPPAASWIEVENPPEPALVLWQSPDGGARIYFVQEPNPQNAPLDMAGLELGTTRQIQGTLINSTEATLKGVPIYTIAARGTAEGNTVYVKQCVISFSGTSYKIMAGGDRDVSADAEIAAVFSSLQILDPSPVPPTAPTAPVAKRTKDPNVLGTIGAYGLILLIIAGIISWARKPKSDGTRPPPLPPVRPS